MIEVAERLPVTDADLLARSVAEPAAFEVLFERHYTTLYRFLAARGSRDADDLAVETFVVAFRRRGSYDVSRRDARPWLFGIALNVARNHARGERRRRRALARLWERDDESEPRALERLDARALAPTLAAALGVLRREERDLLLLHACADFTYEELAETFALPIGTVRSRLHRARERVRTALEGGPHAHR